MTYDEALAERIQGFLKGPTVEERRMFGGLAFLVGGRMCCSVQHTDLMVRAPNRLNNGYPGPLGARIASKAA
jgi:hypothetical protein